MMTMLRKHPLTSTLVATALLLLSPHAHAQETCANPVTIDFDNVPAGTIITRQLSADSGVRLVSALNAQEGSPDIAVVFDSSIPSGVDHDLGTPNRDHGGPGRGSGEGNTEPLGNILVVAQNDDDDDEDGLVDEPNDTARGGDILLNFAVPSRVLSVTMVDVESDGVTVAGFTDLNKETFSVEVVPLGDNSVATVDLTDTPQEPSSRVLVTIRESAALAEMIICPADRNGVTSRPLRIDSACKRKDNRKAKRVGRRRLRRMGRSMRRKLSDEGRKKLRTGRC